METARVSLIAAIGSRSRALGDSHANDLLWHIPDDLKRFKELTTGHPVIMGRRTWESLPEKFRPLPNRTNIIITRDASYSAPGAIVCTAIEDAFEKARDVEGAAEVFVIGGGEIYKQSLSHIDRLYLTLVDDDTPGDVVFPEYENEFTKVIERTDRELNGLHYTWLTLDRPQSVS